MSLTLDNSDVPILGIFVLGERGVGKTSLAHRLVEGDYPAYHEGIEQLSWRCAGYTIDVWDIASNPHFTRSMARNYYRGACLFLSCYDQTNDASLKEGLDIFEVPIDCSIPTILLACKKDEPAVIPTYRALTYASDPHFEMRGPLIEVSSKTGEGIEELRERILEFVSSISNSDRFEPVRQNPEQNAAVEHRKLVFVWCAQNGAGFPVEITEMLVCQVVWDHDLSHDELHKDKKSRKKKCTVM
eukprot:TRINITY_DN6476_c0_g1_i1.p1 TRINITY_DN6476_c0_g1~~TRINITY_DN6476_c0_g1_i1.p1  ORF type:complete len:243 (+),score=24.43 TRINITY_DN6476_c0_g1_i1:175-903(+)